METSLDHRLSRRERQIMDVLFRRGQATVADVVVELPDRPTYSAARAVLRTLEDKGHVRHRENGRQYVYAPTVTREIARRTATAHLVATFFDGSTTRAVAALLGGSAPSLTVDERERLTAPIRRARRAGR